MNGKIASVAKDDGVAVLRFCIVTDGTNRVFGWYGHVRFGDVLSLHLRVSHPQPNAGIRAAPVQTTLSPAYP